MNLNIGARIVLGFLVVLSLMTGLAAYQLGSMTNLRTNSVEILEANLRAQKLLGIIRSSQNAMRVHVERSVGLYFLKDAGLSDLASKGAQQEWELERRASLARIQELMTLANERVTLAHTKEASARWEALARDVKGVEMQIGEISEVVAGLYDALNNGRLDELQTRLQVLDERRDRFNAQMDKLEAHADNMASGAKQSIDTIYEGVRRVFIIALAATLIVALFAIWVLHRSIMPPLYELVSFVDKVGRGDLTQRIKNLGRDEMGRLARQFNEMAANLAEATTQTLAAAANVGGATSQLQASVSQQAASTNEQRSAIQEITTTLNEIAQSGSQISERAKEVAASAEETSGASRSGMEAVSETYRIMGAIGEQAETVAENIVALTEKTRSVGDIITTVNDIAERSNLLALNAAIEAATAGEHGQSFAVVADEMKNLAGQAKEATLQVQSLLNDIQQGINTSVMQTEEAVKRTESGKAQSEKMKETIESLAASIETSVQTFEQIVAATNQQQIGIEQVSQALQDIRSSSSQVADSTRGLEGATANLNALSEQLQKSVQRYKVA
jgi:methyl-accepting chemotaxis protein